MGGAKAAESAKREHKASPGPGPRAACSSLTPDPVLLSQDRLGNAALVQLLRAGSLQRKLEVSEPNDPQELEADRVANRLVSGSFLPAGLAGGRSPIHVQRTCASCAAGAPCDECEDPETPPVRRRADESDAGGSQSRHDAKDAVSRLGSGRPLDAPSRSFFEPRLGRDLSDVRVHTSTEASDAAHLLHALAFTVGRDVAFASGKYAPENPEGQRLLAHELAHVAQGGAVIRRQPDEEAEEEISDLGSKRPGLLSMDYSGPEVCGGQPCFTDEQVYSAAGHSAEVEAIEAESTKNTTPIGVVGPFVVAVGTTRGSAPTKTPPPGTPKIVQGSADPAVFYSTYSMVNRTGHQGTGMGPGVLAGVDEVTLVAHGNQQIVAVGTQHMSPRQLAQTLVDAGWEGGTLRLAACETGICTVGNPFAQTLANELKALGAESVVIAPEANVNIFGGMHGVPQIQPPTPPGGQKPPLLPPGKGWKYFTSEERPGWQIDRSGLKPGAWKGAAVGGAEFVAMIALSILHAKAVAKRTQQETAETGFSKPGPTGDLLYDFGAWILDPTDEAGRSIPFSQRFEMSAWRRTMMEAADRKKPGEYYECSWTTSDGEDSFGTPRYRTFYAKYRKGANGYWYTISCKDCEGEDFPPDLNKIIDSTVSDEEIRVFLELPGPWSGLA